MYFLPLSSFSALVLILMPSCSNPITYKLIQVEDFYAEHQGTEYYDSLIDNMVSGPVLALGLARDDAVKVCGFSYC